MTKVLSLLNDDQHPVRYMHFRTDSFNNYSAKLTPHNRIDYSFGGMTVAYVPVLIQRKDGSIGVHLEMGKAICHGKDRYVKEVGRKLALRALENREQGNYILLYLGEGTFNHAGGGIPLLESEFNEPFINEHIYRLRPLVAQVLGHKEWFH